MIDNIEQIRSLLVDGCTENQFEEMRCPKCGQALTLTVHENRKKFFVRCSNNSTHLAFQGESLKSHDWWAKLVGSGWY